MDGQESVQRLRRGRAAGSRHLGVSRCAVLSHEAVPYCTLRGRHGKYSTVQYSTIDGRASVRGRVCVCVCTAIKVQSGLVGEHLPVPPTVGSLGGYPANLSLSPSGPPPNPVAVQP